MAATVAQIPINDENVQPNVNIPSVLGKAKASTEEAVAIGPVVEATPSEAPVMVEEEEEEVEDVEDEDSEDSDESIDENEEIEDIDSEVDETYGEQSLEGFPHADEAREAEELAKEVGLGSTNEALTHVGASSVRRVSTTLDRYNELLGQDADVKNLYDGLTIEINALRSMINGGIHKVVSDMNVTASPSAVDEARSILESYLRLIVERSTVHCEYRDEETVGVSDVLVTLDLLGRPLYWNEQPSALAQTLADQDEEDDDEYNPMDDADDDEEFSDGEEEEEMSTWDGKDGLDEEVTYFDRPSFRRLVDVINKSALAINEDAYSAIQASAEDYMTVLFTAAQKVTAFAARSNIEQNDIRFARDMAAIRL